MMPLVIVPLFAAATVAGSVLPVASAEIPHFGAPRRGGCGVKGGTTSSPDFPPMVNGAYIPSETASRRASSNAVVQRAEHGPVPVPP